jgi:hypothetical protein
MKKNKKIIIGISLILIVGSILFAAYRILTQKYPGILVLNTDKSVYLPGDQVLFQMASLDDQGKTLCQSKLKLEIKVPGQKNPEILSAETKNLTALSTCGKESVNEPDYIARFNPRTEGKYGVKLTNLDTQKTLKSSFEVVKNAPQFKVERQGAMRVSPLKSDRYTVIIKITSGADYTGDLVETIPLDLKVVWQGEAKVVPANENRQTLTWRINLKQGETHRYAYEFQSAKALPGVRSLGPVTVTNQSKSERIDDSVWNFVYSGINQNL